MKKIIILLLVVGFSFGCSLYNELADDVYESRIQKSEVYYHEDFTSLRTVKDIQDYVYNTLQYAKDTTDTWNMAKETLTKGYGDCEDFAILFMNIYYVVFGEKLDFVLVDMLRSVNKGGLIDHVIVLRNDGTYIGSRGEQISQNIYVGYTYSFDLFFY
jgi:hypothetical protein